MARPLHYLGVFFLFAAFGLLLVTTVSAPVFGDIAILKITLTNQTTIRHSSVTFGTFGHCILDVPPDSTDQDFCFPRSIGYKIADIVSQIDGTTFNSASAKTANGLTGAMILHPIACALAGLAFLMSLGGVCGSLFGAVTALVAWVVTLVVMAIDFALFGIVKNHVNGDGSGNHAVYSVAMWTCLAAMILLFFGAFLVFATCLGDRRRRRATTSNGFAANNAPTTTKTGRRRRFW